MRNNKGKEKSNFNTVITGMSMFAGVMALIIVAIGLFVGDLPERNIIIRYGEIIFCIFFAIILMLGGYSNMKEWDYLVKRNILIIFSIILLCILIIYTMRRIIW